MPGQSQAPRDIPLVLPRGRHAAPRAVVWESQRGRLLEAMAGAVADRGYAQVAVADVIERAGVSRKTFYEHFANKEACFLAAYDAGVDLVLAAIDEALEGVAGDPLGAAVAATRAYLETLADNPEFAQTFLVEVLSAGPAALERRAAVLERFADQLVSVHEATRAVLPDLPPRSRHIFAACVGAIDELVREHTRRHGPAGLPELEEPILEVELSLLVGAELVERLRRP